MSKGPVSFPIISIVNLGKLQYMSKDTGGFLLKCCEITPKILL